MSINVALRTRVSGGGIAPCGVVAIGDGTTSTQTSRPWDEIEYFTTFGKVGAGNYRDVGQQNRSKNESRQMVCGTMYETAGTYTITMYATDGVDFGSDSENVVVADPDTVFSGTNTVCASQDGNFDNAPSGCTQVTTGDFDSFINTYKGSGKRLLLRNGVSRTYTASATVQITNAGPWQIGTFGDAGLRAKIEGINAECLLLSSSGTPTIQDGCIYGLEFDGNNGSNSIFVGCGGGIDNITIWNCYAHHAWRMIDPVYDVLQFLNSAPDTPHSVWAGWVIVECDVTDPYSPGSGGYTLGYMSFQETAFLDVNVTNNDNNSEMCVRMVYSNLVSFQHCRFTGGPVNKTMFNLRCPKYSGDNVVPNETFSQYVFVSDCKLEPSTGSAGAWMLYCGPQNSDAPERIRRVVIDSVWFVLNVNNQQAVEAEGFEITIRNCVADMSAATGGATAFAHGRTPSLHNAANPASMTGNKAYNNTAYSSASGALGNVCVAISSNTSAVIKNNMLWCPNDSSATTISDGSSSTLGGNSTNTQARQATNPFAATISGSPTPSEFVLAAGSYARDAGVTVPVFADLGGWHVRPQNSTYDIGATEYDNGELFPWENLSLVGGAPRVQSMVSF